MIACDVSGVTFPFRAAPWVLPDGFLMMDRAELMDLLRIVIARGKRLGMDCDADYVEWLESLVEEEDDGETPRTIAAALAQAQMRIAALEAQLATLKTQLASAVIRGSAITPEEP